MNTAYHDLLNNGIDTLVSHSVSQESQNVQDLLQKISSEPLQDRRVETRVNNIGLKLTVAETLTMPDPQRTGLEVECHGLTCTAYGVTESVRRSAICEVIKHDPAYATKNAFIKRFKSDAQWEGYIVGEQDQRVMWRHAEGSKTLWDITLNLRGSWFESKHGLLSSLKLMDKLDRLGFKPSRQDWAMNDYGKDFQITQVLEAVTNRNFARFRSFEVHLSGNSQDSVTGLTVDCGSRESDSMTRFYETTVCHDYQANRIELELKGDKAKFFWQYLLSLYRGMLQNEGRGFDYSIPKNEQELSDCFAEEVAKYIIGQVDFVDKTNQWNNKSLENCPRLAWWQKFIDAVGGRYRLTVPKDKPTLKTKGDWMKRQWSNLIGILYVGLGKELTVRLIDSLAENFLNKLDKRVLSEDENISIQILQEKGLSALFG